MTAASEASAALARDRGQEHGEHRDRGRVVEQALALDQDGEPVRCADIAEHRDDRDRIGRRQDGAEHQAGDEPDAGGQPEREAGDGRRHENGDDGKHEDRRDLVEQAADIDIERRLEEQGRQKDVEEGLAAQIEAGQRLEHLAHLAARMRGGKADEDAERAAHDGEQHGEGHLQPRRHGEQQADERQECRDGEERGDDVVHEVWVRPRLNRRAARRSARRGRWRGIRAMPRNAPTGRRGAQSGPPA